jgi:hypothetical protein
MVETLRPAPLSIVSGFATGLDHRRVLISTRSRNKRIYLHLGEGDWSGGRPIRTWQGRVVAVAVANMEGRVAMMVAEGQAAAGRAKYRRFGWRDDREGTRGGWEDWIFYWLTKGQTLW